MKCEIMSEKSILQQHQPLRTPWVAQVQIQHTGGPQQQTLQQYNALLAAGHKPRSFRR
jgi:hypothetical protein